MANSAASFYCPITHELMVDPMIDPEGNSYEKQAIEDWIRRSGTSPITRTALAIEDLRLNRALKTAINEYRDSVQPTVQSSPRSMDIQLSDLTVIGNYARGFIHISIQPPRNQSRSPCDICCVVDTSGSMANRAEIQNDKNEQYGLSQLDLVKHALKTIINSLEVQDRLSIVSFSNRAKILLELTAMNDQGKKDALDATEKLMSSGSTNLWDGLKTGLEVLSKEQNTVGSISALFLLTDGCPTEEPQGGHLESLINLKKKTNFTCAINTFGFGYQLNSKLLEDISILGNSGSYAFIPDGSFVGTIFVNALSILLATAAANVQLLFHGKSLESTDYTQWYSTVISQQGTSFDLGSITYGQNKDLLIPFPPDLIGECRFTLTYDSVRKKKKSLCFGVRNTFHQTDFDQIIRHKFRLEFVHCVRTALEANLERKNQSTSKNKKTYPGTTDQIETLKKEMEKYIDSSDEFLKDLFADLTGQVKEALEREDRFNKWGAHFLPSLTRAHLLQFCNNFKDPGVQHYGKGVLFSSVRDDMDGIFCGLPAPKLSQTGTKIDMSVFNNRCGGCFHGDCIVRLMDGTTKLIKDVQPGDQMASHGGKIVYVIKTKCLDQKTKMVILEDGLIITAWHPIRLHQQWIMPCSLVSSPSEIECDAVYNFALDQGHTVLVNQVECVTLGHRFKEDVVRHAYYGSQRVIEDLRRLDFEQNHAGFIEINEESLLRNKQTGLVGGLQLRHILVQ